MSVKALTFDIIGTAFDWFGSLSSGAVPLSHKYGLGLDPSTFAHEAADGYAPGVAAVPPWVAPDVILRDSMTTLLAAYGTPSPAEVDDFFALWRSLNPWEDVPSSLWALHNHFTLVILSNMSVATQSALMDRAGLPFDRTLSAETVEAYKPSPAVYEMAISSLGLAPDEIMMVAAHKYDLAAARSRGFATAFVARALEQGPAGTVDTTPDPTADINATSFTGVVHALGADPPPLDEDGIAINPEAVEVQQIAGSRKVIDGSDWLLDFGASQADADRAREVISHYRFNRICYVGRPDPPMMYFTVNGSAPAGPMPGEDAIAFDLAAVRVELLGDNWTVTDGNSAMLDFGASHLGGLHAVALIRDYGFTHQCFLGRPHAPMMYFRR
ncbi:haloacid dehalogenase type II [Mycobacterium sp.]|uniref:haloacid dehalogenase type II n=1 Tax=Mycobacterium sp. TaxID=1785 RepID=UPI002D179876|nr:haloacid dehalogenase type II [Mycobacterium sp.]HME48300.1 haloacid dehalogenase type II [Mycobacterium sp.]